ncbi:MAG: hypothetical protein U0L72_02695 [Acutalibacteraceae bacterium]|nr:hypothetical protein [Acutalibacteraceae bacterium]
MTKLYTTTIIMMWMCMWICQMCMCLCALISDMFSMSKKKHCTA